MVHQNYDRIKLEVYNNLPELLKTIKLTSICAEFNTTPQWLNGRIKQNKNGKYSVRGFTENDIVKLNKGIWSLANKLLNARIEYSEDRQYVIEQIKDKYSGVFLKSIAINKMGWTESKFKAHMVKSSSKGNYLTFKEKDIKLLVLSVREIALRMLSIEYYLM